MPRRSPPPPQDTLLDAIRQQLAELGIDLDDACCDTDAADDGKQLKVICLAADLRDSVAEMGRTTRDQVVMVRVDDETAADLDAWIEAGAVKSRSEAAALFIREGLKVRASELAQLREALRDLERARRRLRAKAREVIGKDADL